MLRAIAPAVLFGIAVTVAAVIAYTGGTFGVGGVYLSIALGGIPSLFAFARWDLKQHPSRGTHSRPRH